ncbi:hypothetical protein [Roseospira goensis]|uniref:Uncharacterized protein n=1 Tax=Roseospira goensis TaxID=391922 RepID=A0A7W6RXV2_9PROT|nr:hypothetical protein [Roseospira goensis]MBB4285218.1 hypothetical protein [Roseospira goensis]
MTLSPQPTPRPTDASDTQAGTEAGGAGTASPGAANDAGTLVHEEVRRHAIDARLSIPLFRRRFYLVVLAGRELRAPGRRARERDHHPLLTLGNVLFLAAVVGVVYALALVALVFFRGVMGG